MRMMKKRERILVLLAILIFIVFSIYDITYRKKTEKVNITFGMFAGGQWDVPNDDCYKIIDEAILKFEKKYPNVTVKYISGIQKDYYSEWISELVLKDEIPDVMMVLPEDFELFAEKGILMNLSDHIKRDQNFDLAKYYPGCYEAGNYRGNQYALPYESNPTLMFFNKTLLDKYNITINPQNWTWNQFYEDCKILSSDANKDGTLDSYGVCGYSWLDALYTNGAGLFDRERNVSNFTSDNVDESITFAKRIIALSGYQNPGYKDFDLGKVGFATMKFSEFKTYKPYPYKMNKYKIFDWDCISLPYHGNKNAKSYTNNLLLGISSRCMEDYYAWEFMKMLSYDPDIQQKIYTYSQGVSVLRDVTNSEATNQIFVEMLGKDSQFDNNMLDNIMETSVPLEMLDNYGYIMDYASGVITRVILNQEDMDVALINIKNRVDSYLNEKDWKAFDLTE